MKTKGFTAVVAERLFLLGMLALVVLLIADFIFATRLLQQQAQQTDHSKIKAEISDDDISNVNKAGQWLRDHPDEVKRVNRVVAESKLYHYQNQIIADVQEYAGKVGVGISGYNFPAPTTTAAPGAANPITPTATSTPTPAAITPSQGATPPIASSSAAPPGVNTVAVNITLDKTVNYLKLIHFLQLIERNVTRMQITNVSLAPDSTSPDSIASPSISLLVYTSK